MRTDGCGRGQDWGVLLAVGVVLLIAFPVAALRISSQRGLNVRSATAALAIGGGELLLLGYLLTPGFAWGRDGEHSTFATVSTIVWLAGVVLLLISGARWLRSRRTSSPG